MSTRPVALDEQLAALATVAMRERASPDVHVLALEVTASSSNRRDTMRLLVDELHRRFRYAPDPTEVLGSMPRTHGNTVDVDDACIFVAALAGSLGICCRFVAARYDRSWTLFLDYETEDGRWETIDPLRHPGLKDPDERIEGPGLGGADRYFADDEGGKRS